MEDLRTNGPKLVAEYQRLTNVERRAVDRMFYLVFGLPMWMLIRRFADPDHVAEDTSR